MLIVLLHLMDFLDRKGELTILGDQNFISFSLLDFNIWLISQAKLVKI